MSHESVSIDTSNENKGPTVEESYEALREEGLIQEDTPGETPGGAQGDGNAPGSTDERPEWLPEKFKTPEDMAKAYAELEKKQGSAQETSEEAETSESTETDETPSGDVSFEAYTQEYAENGELSEGSYEALEKAGISRTLVDAFIAGQEARNAQFESSVMEMAGGNDAYVQMIEWAKSNLTDSEIDAYDEAVNSRDMRKAEFAVKGLKARFASENAQDPQRQLSGKGGNQSTSRYESTAQMLSDMSDPRYETDPAFRRQVEEKIARSDVI